MQTTTITPQHLKSTHIIQGKKRPLHPSWYKTFGIAKDRKKDLERYMKKLRAMG